MALEVVDSIAAADVDDSVQEELRYIVHLPSYIRHPRRGTFACEVGDNAQAGRLG